MPLRYDNILETIGDTPIVKINRLAPEGVTMYAKAEFFNPCSSVKDRYVPVRDRTRVRFSVSRPIDAGSDPHRPRGRPDGTTHAMILVLPLLRFSGARKYSAKSGREPKTRRFHLRGRLDERRRAATRTGLEHASKPHASSTFFHNAHTKDTELTERARHSVFPTRTRVRATVWLSP